MPIPQISVDVVGSDAVVKEIQEFNYRSARYALRYALYGGAAILQKYLSKDKDATPVWSGMLKSSWGMKRSSYKKRNVYVLVGVKRRVSGFRVPATAQKSVQKAFKAGAFEGKKKPKRQTPARYVHLLERGHRGRWGNYVEGKHVLRRAVIAKSGEIQSEVIRRLKERLSRLRDPEILE
jgi:hypothetical protein